MGFLDKISLQERTLWSIFHECPSSWHIPLICVLLWVEFRRIDRLGNHLHSISMSEWDDNDQFAVCWAGRNRSGKYFCYGMLNNANRGVMGKERADFAAVSALSLPRILTWLGIQHKMIVLLQDAKKIVKKSPAVRHRTTLSGYIFATKARIDNRKKNC